MRAHRPYDHRTIIEVLDSLRSAGVPAQPSLFGYAIRKGQERGVPLTFMQRGTLVQPLTGVSNTEITCGNESGVWTLVHADERGFNNAPGLWRADSVDLALLGDSYTFGTCVPSDSNIAGWIQQRVPRTLNVGVGGSGPLSELARLREYLPAVRPRVVVWIFTELNDFDDLTEEKRNPILNRYLEPRYQQGLAGMQPQIDAHVAAFFRQVADSARVDDARWRFRKLRLRDLLTLSEVQRALRVPSLRTGLPSVEGTHCCAFERYDYALLRRVFDEAHRTVDSWGGHLYIAILPDQAHFVSPAGVYCRQCQFGGYLDSLTRARDRVSEVARQTGLPVIDLHAALESVPDYQAIHSYPGSHFNPSGYHIVASAILDALGRRGELPPSYDVGQK